MIKADMGSFLQILVFVGSGIILLWFGYMLFFGSNSPFRLGGFSSGKTKKKSSASGFEKINSPQYCPVCSKKLGKGENVRSTAFPAFAGSKERLVRIQGCHNCLENNRPRRCPVCETSLSTEDFLISKMFEREVKNHIHVLGCNHCKKT